jgi:hypothetical protein
MIKLFFKGFIARHRDLLYQESRNVQNFMHLLMKQKNTGTRWTDDESKQIKVHLKHLSLYVPALIIFMLPCGPLLLTVLAEILDRRKQIR